MHYFYLILFIINAQLHTIYLLFIHICSVVFNYSVSKGSWHADRQKKLFFCNVIWFATHSFLFIFCTLGCNARERLCRCEMNSTAKSPEPRLRSLCKEMSRNFSQCKKVFHSVSTQRNRVWSLERPQVMQSCRHASSSVITPQFLVIGQHTSAPVKLCYILLYIALWISHCFMDGDHIRHVYFVEQNIDTATAKQIYKKRIWLHEPKV